MKSLIVEKIKSAISAVDIDVPKEIILSEPPKPEMGDWSTNIAMVLAVKDKSNPRELAEKVSSALRNDPSVDKVEVAGPGFINIFVKPEVYFAELEKILALKENYGRKTVRDKKTVNVEYVSANPTGPLHIGNARSGPIGDAIANLYKFIGHDVVREYYVNDVGSQVEKFGKSLFYYFEKKTEQVVEFPTDGYPGKYIEDISSEIESKYADELSQIDERESKIKLFKEKGLELIVAEIKSDCALLDINFDLWTRQSEIENSDKVAATVEKLKLSGATIEKEGALWLKIDSDPDLQDRETVLKKSDENHTLTYFATDIAYHLDKLDRGADELIDIWGANHDSHVSRMKAALRALSVPEDSLDVVLYQWVRLKRAGQVVSMGKRLGNFVTLREVIEGGVDKDVFKYFILSQNANTPIDFDLDLAADTSEKNPVYYIKYAHARICSVLVKAGTIMDAQGDYSLLKNNKEVALYKELVKFPDVISEVADNFQIQALAHYVYGVAALFHDFYGSCKVVGAETKEIETARLSLILATKYIISNSLEILGILAPEKM